MAGVDQGRLREWVRASGFELPERFDAFAFGDSAESADALADLVLSGSKTATSWLLWADEATPVEGEANAVGGEGGAVSVVLDGRGEPVAVIEALGRLVVPFEEVPAEFARDEGEGDLSLEYWRREHWGFFSRVCGGIGRVPSVRMPVVCERFRVIHRVRSPMSGRSP